MSNKKKKSAETSSPTRSLTFTIELYPEWNNYTNILSHIQKEKYAYIVHDKDTYDDGEVKKIHSHVVVKYGGRRTLSSVKNEYKIIGVPSNLVNTCNERAMLRYLIHLDNPEKYQYTKDSVKTNMMDECASAWNDEITSDEAFLMLNKYISESTEYISATDMNMYSIKQGYLRGLKAYSSQLNNARVEHNRMYEFSNAVERTKMKNNIEEHNKFKTLEEALNTFGSIRVQGDNGQEYVMYKPSKNEENNNKNNVVQVELDLFHGAEQWIEENNGKKKK